ncbi:hypothetical protein J7T55_000332 [Diaporthe amygdali]|uniref:uncharacterized protein n=1 Tax=Phomopsis amygdali TaxID=1214568 RepID=UPI0022FE4D66|nr:uncharacterized protein J7T55_000332 [Diaporthe amygdali]KAJ0109407.1 hypothetical protein J7T55_000332 [Diaporthe amygdali]
MTQASDRRSIADRSRDVKQSMLDLLRKTRVTKTPFAAEAVEDILDRFKLWTGSLGAFHQAHKRMSLESRLADSSEIRDHICEQLDDMQEAIHDLLPLCSDSGADVVDGQESLEGFDIPPDGVLSDAEFTSREQDANLILSMVSQCLKALFRIGILVRKATPRDRFERALQQAEFSFPVQFDTNYVQERHPKLSFSDARWLACRLGSANAKRRQFINYVRDHKAKLEVEDTNSTADAVTAMQSSKATTFVVPKTITASEFLQSPLGGDDDSISLVSASTAFDKDTNLKLPNLADLGPDGEYFECPICFTLQSFHKETSWKQQEDVRQSTSNHQADILVSLTQFKRHVATHQEQLAIFAVPKVFDDNEDTSHEAVEMSSLASTSDDGHSQSPHEETVPIESSPSHELSSTRVNVTNLPRGINIADIEAHFRSTGSGGITEIKLMDGLGFIDFKDPLAAQRSVASFDGSNFMGECIGVRLAPSSLGRDPGTMDVADDPHSQNWQTAATINDINSANPRSKSSRRINSKGQVVAVFNHKQKNLQEEPSPSYMSAVTYAKRA